MINSKKRSNGSPELAERRSENVRSQRQLAIVRFLAIVSSILAVKWSRWFVSGSLVVTRAQFFF